MNRLTNAISVSRKPSRLRRWLKAVAIVAALGLLWVAYVQWRIHSVPSRTADGHRQVAIVLGASLWDDAPSPGLRERLDRAYELYAAKAIDRIIVSGGLDANGATITEAEGMKRYLTERGVPAEAVVEEREATSTYENLLFSKRIMDREGWSQPVIVTHAFHGARALDIARFVGLDGATVSLMESKVMSMPWHKSRETLAFTKWIADKLRMKAGL
ncbi:SanA/YdcF family protein [Paenibacillus flagellatus]|uniref:YdcF family protein n=1 Tax=Paenibacillus flagellatus TaxID=2211139 RepID=A0A2V5KV74_9BACL|nr:YdcF family protein [Paenibacillus flagellatus]PYI55987.1 YdcF family protein [Paenibacillus flagellatus]